MTAETAPTTAKAPIVPATAAKTETKTDSGNGKTEIYRPWYRAGGMKVKVGMGINVFLPLIVLVNNLSKTERNSFLSFLAISYILSFTIRKTMYCIVVVPSFMSSLLLCTTLHKLQPQIALSLALALTIMKVNIFMSVCLHRYAAHSAFKCGPITSTALLIMGCLANQGGPIWWASKHRLHHKYCDVKRDPHSPVMDGVELAFSFFEIHDEVEEEFTPVHVKSDSVLLRVIDTWAWIPVFAEFWTSYYFFGIDGLFVSWTSGWLCQAITLWFNVVNHPPTRTPEDEKKGACNATNGKDTKLQDMYIPFMILDALVPLFAFFVKEAEHEHHHNFAKLAKRSKYDVAYWGFIWPLEKAGLLWDVVV